MEINTSLSNKYFDEKAKKGKGDRRGGGANLAGAEGAESAAGDPEGVGLPLVAREEGRAEAGERPLLDPDQPAVAQRVELGQQGAVVVPDVGDGPREAQVQHARHGREPRAREALPHAAAAAGTAPRRETHQGRR